MLQGRFFLPVLERSKLPGVSRRICPLEPKPQRRGPTDVPLKLAQFPQARPESLGFLIAHRCGRGTRYFHPAASEPNLRCGKVSKPLRRSQRDQEQSISLLAQADLNIPAPIRLLRSRAPPECRPVLVGHAHREC